MNPLSCVPVLRGETVDAAVIAYCANVSQIFGAVWLPLAVIAGLALAVLKFFGRRMWRWLRTQASRIPWRITRITGQVRVTQQPTSGPAPDIRLGVRNNGEPAVFGANCRIFASRNTGGRTARLGTYEMSWDDGGGREYLVTGAWGNLMVARWEQIGQPYDRLAEMRLIVQGGGQFDQARWNMTPDENAFPAWGLEVSILRVDDRPAQPHMAYYQVQPEHYGGPLQMRELRGPHLDEFA